MEDQVIRTTSEHPFYVQNKGWLAAQDIEVGDRILASNGSCKQVTDFLATGEWEKVYNLRVADNHTYFVGDDHWGWNLWSHNAYKIPNHKTIWAVANPVARASHSKWGTFYKSAVDGLWWSKDLTKHGGSHWKVFRETSKGLSWIADADLYGNFILNKHKSVQGAFIPWNQLRLQ